MALGAGLFPQEPLRIIAERRLQQSLGPACQLRRLHVIPFRLSAEVDELHVETASITVTIPRLEVRLSPRILLGHTIAVRQLSILGPDVTLRGGGEESERTPINLPAVHVQSIEIRDGRLAVNGADGAAVLRAQGMRAAGSIGQGVLAVDVDSIETPYGPKAVLAARVRVSPQIDLDLRSIEIRTPGSRLRVTGHWPRALATPTPADLQVDGAFDLAEIPSRYVASRGHLVLEGQLRSGQQDGPRVTVSAHSDGPLEAAGVPIEELKVEATHSETAGERVRVDARTTRGGRVEVAGTLVAGRLDATLRIASLSPSVWPEDLGLPKDARLDGLVQAQGPIDGALRTHFSAQARASLGSVRTGIHVEAEGQVRPSRREMDIAWTLNGQATGSAAGPLRETRWQAQGNATGAWPPMVEGRLNADSRIATSAGVQHLALLGGVRYGDDETSVVLTGSGLGAELEGTVAIKGDRVDAAHLHLTGLDLAQLDPTLRGAFTLEGNAHGPLRALRHTVVIDGQGVAWRGVPVGPVIGRASGEGPKGDFDLSLPDLHVVSVGAWTPSQANVSLQLDNTPLAPLTVLAGSPLSGSATLKLDASIPFADPRQATGQIDVTTLAVESGQVRVALQNPWTARIEDQHIVVEPLRLAGPGTTFEARGSLALGQELGLDLAAGFNTDLPALPAPKSWSLTGSLVGQAHLTGTASVPQAQGDVRWTGVTVNGPGLPSLAVTDGALRLEGRDIRIPDMQVALADGLVRVEAFLPLALLAGPASSAGAPAATARVRWSGLDLAKVLASTSPAPPEVRGTVTGELALRAPALDKDAIEARITLPETALSFGDTNITVEPALISMKRLVVSTDGVNLRSGGARLVTRGEVDLAEGTLALRSEGVLELRPLSSLLTDTALAGRARLDLSVNGTLQMPAPHGTVGLEGISVRTRSFPQPLTGLNGRVNFADHLLTLEGVEAQLGGGTLTATGSARIAESSVENVKVDVSGRDLALRYPEGLRSRLDLDLKLRGQSGNLVLGGDVRVQRGLYTLDLVTEKTFMASAPAVVASPVLRGVRLDLGIQLVRPVRVRNDVAHLAADGRLDLRGTLESPEPYGHLEIVTPGAQLLFQGRVFDVESGRLAYDGTWVPRIDLVATTPVRVTDSDPPYDTQVRAEAHGTSTEISEAWLARLAGSNDPSLDAVVRLSSSAAGLTTQQLASYLSTGRQNLSGQEARVVGEQAATLVANRLAGLTLRGLGLDEVQFQPELVSRETNPGPRFTFGKRLSSRVRVVYSQGLANAESWFFQVEGRPVPTMLLTLTRNQEPGQGQAQGETKVSYVYGIGQRISLGGPKHAKRFGGHKDHEDRARLAAVDVNGAPPISDRQIRHALRLSQGKRTTAWAVQDAAERLRLALVQEGYIEAQVDGDLVDDVATFNVSAGPHFSTEVEGMGTQPDLHVILTKALFEDEALDRCREALLRRLWREGYLRAQVRASVRGDETERILHFAVTPGRRWNRADISFPGAKALSQAQLRSACGGIGAAIETPDVCRQRVTDLYRQRHFLRAQAAAPSVSEQGDAILVEVPVTEGAPAAIKAVTVEGIDDPTERDTVAGLLRLKGQPYSDATLVDAMQRVRVHFLASGHPYVRVLPRLVAHDGDYDAAVEVVPGQRVVIRSIEIEGASGGQAARLRDRSGLHVGDPLDPRRLAIAERTLSAIGGTAQVSVLSDQEDPSKVRIVVTRTARAQVGYDLRYDKVDGWTKLVDGELRNLPLGSTLGARYSQGARITETRGSLFVPGLGGRGLTVVGYKLHEDLSTVDPDFGEIIILRDQIVTQLQQSWSLPDRWNLLGGYQFKRVTVTDLAPVRIATLSASLLRDTRDNPMDARRGRFWSLNLELADGRLASDASYIKGFAQAFQNRPLTPAFQWSQGFRLGLAHTFDGQPLVSFERFYAGGANSVRGFATDSIGPRDFFGDPAGGQATFIVNEELRYRHRTGLGLAVFYDLGNVFQTVGDMRLNARHAVGLGLRYSSPVGLVRVDLGFPIARQEGEATHQWYISLGQAF